MNSGLDSRVIALRPCPQVTPPVATEMERKSRFGQRMGQLHIWAQAPDGLLLPRQPLRRPTGPCGVDPSPVSRTPSGPPGPLGAQGEVGGETVRGPLAVATGSAGGPGSCKDRMWDAENEGV